MSTTCEKYSYRYFTDKWMLLVVIWFYFVIRYQLMPGFITDVYLPFILCFAKFIWTKTSYIRIFDDRITYCHKELATYLKKTIYAKDIKRMYFKVLFFTMIDKQYGLVEYSGDDDKINSLLLNLERFPNPDRVRSSLVTFCKRNNIEIIY
ncbi:MAG: hypothetical protein WCQ53_04595 [bacterium]